MKSKLHLFKQEYKLNRTKRQEQKRHKSALIWFTGLSGSGKSTLANALEKELFNSDIHTYVLDGDNIRMGLNKDLDFSKKGREENIRRIAEVSKLFIDSGIIVLSAFVSPFEKNRQLVKQIVGDDNFIQVFVDCPIEVCEQRDVKGLYKKVRKGEIKDFTGINSPFEIPKDAYITIDTSKQSISISTKILKEKVLDWIKL